MTQYGKTQPGNMQNDRVPMRAVAVIGGGVSGLSAACALADAGFRVTVFERRGYLGGRASSYFHPAAEETIDNCQHVLFGCNTNLIEFYRRIGSLSKIRWDHQMTMIEPGGRRTQLGPSSLPAPLHGLPALLGAACFNLSDKLALARAFSAILRGVSVDSTETLAAWLTRHGQTKNVIERFWRLVIASALNSDLDVIAMPYAAMVIRELFLSSAEAGAMGMSTVPLSELYLGARRFLEDRGGSIAFQANVESATWDETVPQWKIVAREEEFRAEAVIFALPFEAMLKLLPNLPAAEGTQAEEVEQLKRQAEQMTHWPICSVHLWFDRQITELDHAVLLDRELHWMYHKSRLQPWRKDKGSYVELVVSASREFAALPREEAIGKARRELAEFFPIVAQAHIEKSVLIKEVRATFGVPPGIDTWRPAARSPWPRAYLAGDWAATGWPSTMESAARAGHLAAEALCHATGDERAILVPDLAPTGWMSFLGKK